MIEGAVQRESATEHASTERRQHAIERFVAEVRATFHARVHHAVALGGGMEERGADELGAPVRELFEGHGLDRHVGRHAVPLEARHDAFNRHDFPITALETMHAMVTVLDEAPVTAALELEALDDESITAPPPLRDQLGLGHRLPDTLALGIEDALEAKAPLADGAEECTPGRAHCLVHHSFPFVRSRNASR